MQQTAGNMTDSEGAWNISKSGVSHIFEHSLALCKTE